MERRRPRRGKVSGTVWLQETAGTSLGSDRIALLEKVGELGSITKAARAVGVSYRTAWTVVDALDKLAGTPLFVRSVGGRGGGGTVLTGEGREVVRRYRIIQGEHARFLASLAGKIGDPDACYRLFRRIAMRVSARNVFLGRVTGIRKGAVNAEVELSLKGGNVIVAVVTNESADALALTTGSEACAIVKASSVLLGKELHSARISARNVLCGTVARIAEGPVNAEVAVTLSGGNTVTAVITDESVKRLGLKVGDHACAAIKASSVILGVG